MSAHATPAASDRLPEEGAAALAHGHRGRKPVNATPEAVIADVVRLASTRYQGANHTHLGSIPVGGRIVR